jgi:hypothetical protein
MSEETNHSDGDKPAVPLQPVVRLFIVQERYNGGEWLDDPDQPDDYTHGFDQAKWWMENDNKTCRGHETTYEHRIVERTETQVWPNPVVSGQAARNEP